jgi:replicative DNA helicase
VSAGLKPGQLCIPIARTATGKTQFLINIAYNVRCADGRCQRPPTWLQTSRQLWHGSVDV